MREKNDLTQLFRTRLEHAEMDVRNGFWEAMEHDLHVSSVPSAVHKPTRKYKAFPLKRWMAAASVLLLLGAAAWRWWPSETKQEVLPPSRSLVEADGRYPDTGASPVLAEISPRLSAGKASRAKGKGCVPGQVEETTAASGGEPMSVHVSITITQRQYGSRQPNRQRHYHAAGDRSFTDGHSSWTEEDGMQQEAAPTTSMEDCGALLKSRNWALKASLGTSLPQGDFCAPLTADLSVERRLTKRLALEAGVQYNRLAGHGEETLHTLGIPVKLNILLAQSSKVDFYAQLGGMVEKCVSGAPDNSFAAEPVQGSLLAGLGVSYKLSDRLALFAEPSVSHHFDSDASTRTLRTERALNVNLLCGLRMTY